MPSSGLATALKAEWFTTRRSPSIWLLLFLPAAAAAVRLLLVKMGQLGNQAQAALNGNNTAEVANGYGYFVDGLLTGFTLLFLVFMGLAAFSFASDRDHGAVRHLVIRSVSRQALVAAKFVMLALLALAAVALVAAVSLGVAAALWDFGPVVEDGFELIGVAEIHEEIRLGTWLALTPLPACIALGLLISVLARSATQAVTLALGTALVLDIFKGVLGSGAQYVYASFQPSLIDRSYLSEVTRIVRGYSDVLIDERVLMLNQWIPLPQALVFFLLALFVIGNKRL